MGMQVQTHAKEYDIDVMLKLCLSSLAYSAGDV